MLTLFKNYLLLLKLYFLCYTINKRKGTGYHKRDILEDKNNRKTMQKKEVMFMWDKLDKTEVPTWEDISSYVRNPLCDEFFNYLTEEYKVKPTFEFSRCSMPGWNVKFRKSGKNLCTIYPDEGFFTVLVVIGRNEKEEFEKTLFLFTPYMQDLYYSTREGMGQHWLFIVPEDRDVLEDIKGCIAIRRGRRSDEA